MGSVPRGKRVAFVGLGYVGLSTAVCLASKGFKVLGIDVDLKKVKLVADGVSPIHERGLAPLLRSSVRRKNLAPQTDFGGIKRCDVIFVTVGTPSLENGEIDSRFVESAAVEIGRQLSDATAYKLVVVKSTVTPGTTEGLVRKTIERESGKKAGRDFGLASNPEFLHEGSAIEETFHPDALVIGGHDRRSSAALRRMYAAFYGTLPPTIMTSPSNAEMMKYAINAGRAAQVSYINTIANFCSRVPGCDYAEVRKGLSLVAKMDQRYLSAGLGFGGSCLPKDTRALAAALGSAGVSNESVATAMRVNEGQVDEAIRLAETLCGPLNGKKVSVLGLAFKPDTDDVRESVSISLAIALLKKDASVAVYDPAAMDNARMLLGNRVTYAKTELDCLAGSECTFIATGWERFKKIKPKDFTTRMASPVVIDGRRLYDQDSLLKGGVSVATIGTGPRSDN